MKDALADVSIFTYIAVRFALAAAVMGILFWRALRELNRHTIWAGVQIGFFMFGGYAFQTTGLKFTTASKAAFITGSSVVLVPVFLAAFGRRRINIWIWLGAFSALAGLYFLMIPPEGFGSLNRGDAIALGCAVMFALHVIFIGQYVERHSVGALSFLQVATTAVLATFAVPLLSASEMGSASARVVRAAYFCRADYGDRVDCDWFFISDVGAAVHHADAHGDIYQPRACVCGDYGVDCGARAAWRPSAFWGGADSSGDCAGGAEGRCADCAGIARADCRAGTV